MVCQGFGGGPSSSWAESMSDSAPPDPPKRGRPIHQLPMGRGNRALIIFLTVCTRDRQRVLASPEMHQALLGVWGEAQHWLVGRYVILPDHIHLFCAPGTYPPHPLLNWVRYWKSRAAKSVGCGAATLWQKNFWDIQLRHHESYSAKWEYVRRNPVRHGLVREADEWPFKGEPNILGWHE